MEERPGSPRRTPRRSEVPREGSSPRLTPKQLEKILKLLPGWQRKFDQQQIEHQIQQIRQRFSSIRQLAPELWRTKAERRRAIEQLGALSTAADTLLRELDRLGPLATLSLVGDARRFGVDRAGTLSEWSCPKDSDVLERAKGTALFLSHFANEEVRTLLAIETKRGAPTKLADRQLAADLWSLWAYVRDGRGISPDGRATGGWSWPFLDLLRAVGRTVDPEFSGEGAARRIYEIARGARVAENGK